MCLTAALQELTNYQFDCEPRALHGALDRFAQFFLAPLCKADALEREVSAVDNEFAGESGHISWSTACDC
jgi:nardilysin